jgi:hypothetical protein
MRDERRALLMRAVRESWIIAVPAGLLGLGLGYVATSLLEGHIPGLTSAAAGQSVLLAAVVGVLGGVIAGLLNHSVFEEDKEISIITVGFATVFVIVGGVSGVGHESYFYCGMGLAAGVPVGLLCGVLMSMLYTALKHLFLWGRKETRGY